VGAKLRKRLLMAAGVVALALCGAFVYWQWYWQPRFPETPYPQIAASQDPRTIREGEYLVKAVAHCTNCHLPKGVILDTSPEATWRLIPSGGGEWDLGAVGTLYSPNLTSDVATGLGGWSDAQIARAIRYGIDRDGRALIYMIGVGPMDDRDLRAIVSYLRILQPVKARIPESQITFEGTFILRTEMPGLIQPKPQFPVAYAPPGGISIARGAYLANGPAMCFSCHSNEILYPSLAVDGPRFAGSLQPYPDPDNPTMEINAPNLTPSAKYGHLNGWTEQQFVLRIRAGRAIKNSAMPWENFRLMTDTDLISVFRYLRSLKPVDRDVGPDYRPVGWKPTSF